LSLQGQPPTRFPCSLNTTFQEIYCTILYSRLRIHRKLERNKATPPRAATCMPHMHAEASGNTVTYVSLHQGVGWNVVLGICRGREDSEEDLIRTARQYITTSTRGSGGPSFQIKNFHHMRTKCVGRTVGVSKSLLTVACCEAEKRCAPMRGAWGTQGHSASADPLKFPRITIRCSASQVPLSWQAFTIFRTWGPSVFPDGNNGIEREMFGACR
jgi:hypothetical protein